MEESGGRTGVGAAVEEEAGEEGGRGGWGLWLEGAVGWVDERVGGFVEGGVFPPWIDSLRSRFTKARPEGDVGLFGSGGDYVAVHGGRAGTAG